MSSRPRPSVVRLLRWAALAVVLGFCLYALADQWRDAQDALRAARPAWSWIAASGALVLLAYAVLIQVWRTILGGAGERLRYRDAARIWTVSNLGRYVPGKVWQMAYMAHMARERGVSGVAAAGSAVLSTLVTVATGMAVLLSTGAALVGDRRAILGAGAVAALLLVGVPLALPVVEAVGSRVLRRSLGLPRIDAPALVTAIIGSSAAWIALGAAFHALGLGVGLAMPSLPLSIAAFVGSYLAGFLALFAPGGVGVREITLGAMLERTGMAMPEALVLVVASRVWLTLLEIGPALVFLAAMRDGGAVPLAAPERGSDVASATQVTTRDGGMG